MRAWQFTEVGRPLTLNEVDEPEPTSDELVISVKASGLCHSDVGFIDGTLTSLLPFRPITLGHEFAGVVTAVGSAVSHFRVGDRVGVPCAAEGPGTSKHGAFAESVLVKEHLVVSLPDVVSFEHGAAASCAGVTAYHAIVGQGNVMAGMRVGIIGLGGVGALGAQIAVARGAEVFAAEVNEKARSRARELGVTAASDSILAFSGELDVIVDFAGFGSTTAAAIDASRRDGLVVQVGLGVEFSTINAKNLTLNQIRLVGSQAGSVEDYAATVELMGSGQVSVSTSPISFEQIGEQLGALERGEANGRLTAILD